MIPVVLYGIDVNQCEQFYNTFTELLSGVNNEEYEAMLYRIHGPLSTNHLDIIDEWAGYVPMAWLEEVSQEVLSALNVSRYPSVAMMQQLLNIDDIDVVRLANWLHFLTRVYPIWNSNACAGLRRLGLQAPFENDIAAYGIYVQLIEGIKEYAPMDALPESPLPRQRLLELALAEWSKKP